MRAGRRHARGHNLWAAGANHLRPPYPLDLFSGKNGHHDGRVDIANLTVETIRDVVRGAVRTQFDPDQIEDFVATVDWSHAENADETVRSMLGCLEQWSIAFAEGDQLVPQYIASLITLLPANECPPGLAHTSRADAR